MDYEFLVDGKPRRISVEIREGKVIATTEGGRLELDAARPSGHTVSLLAAGRSYRVHIAGQGNRIFVAVDTAQFCLEVPEQGSSSKYREESAGHGDGTVKAPMPGLVIKINVAEGEEVAPGDSLAVVEAMKMEHEMRASVRAIVAKVHVKEGQQVDAFQPLVDLKITGS